MTDLRALNSATKYPSIPTYHELDPSSGGLLETATQFTGEVVLTEKVDGTNARIVLMPDGDWFIGSREELLYARGDRVGNPSQGIVDALRTFAEGIIGLPRVTEIQVMFLEVYGHKIGGQAKQYTTTGQVGFRMFDVAFIDPEILSWERDRIASWRDSGGQTWATEEALTWTARNEGVPIVPRLATLPASELPSDVEGTHDWLGKALPNSWVALDDSAGGRPEGIVLRSADRSVIAKARFQDYERTLKRRAQEPLKVKRAPKIATGRPA